MERLLDTRAASKYLEEKGVSRTEKTLRKLRCLGGGPTYRLLNGKPFYTEPGLDAWVEERLSAPMRSTSETDAT